MIYRFLYFLLSMQFVFSNFVHFGGELFLDGQNMQNISMGNNNYSFGSRSNPATLIFSSNNFIHFSYKDKFSNLLNVTCISYLFNKSVNSTKYPIYLGVITRSLDDIPDTRTIKQFDGSKNYFKIKYFKQQEIGFVISSALKKNNLYYGFTLKPYHISLAEFYAVGVSADIGIATSINNKMIILGSEIENIFSFNYWNTKYYESYVPKLNLIGQIKKEFISLSFELDRLLSSHYKINYSIGLELQNKNIFYRFGYIQEYNYNFGLGINYKSLQIDYTYINNIGQSYFGISQIWSIAINIDKLKKIKYKLSP